MRVISGKWKGLRLESPLGQEARPTTDRVKESMFHLMGVDWQGGVAVDLFAGSGALAIEALSRGAQWAVFIDKSPRSMSLVRKNLERCRANEYADTFIGTWARGWNHAIEFSRRKASDVGWVFVDPPYGLNLWETVLTEIGQAEVPVAFGVVCEHPKSVCLPGSVASLTQWKQRAYGDIALTLYRDDRVVCAGRIESMRGGAQ